MNFLAHLLLAEATDLSRIGNFLGDFVKGPVESFQANYPQEVVAGIVNHRQIDAYVEDHRLFQNAKRLLEPVHGHYSGIIVDVLGDHFLHRHWGRFSKEDKSTFIGQCYRALKKPLDNLPLKYQRFSQAVITYDLLNLYEELDGVEEALWRVGERCSRENSLKHARPTIEKMYQPLEQLFLEMMPLLQAEFSGRSR